MSPPPPIFDRDTRGLRRDRVARQGKDDLEDHLQEAFLDRLDATTRRLAKALVINTGFGGLAAALRARQVEVIETDHGRLFAGRAAGHWCDEDRLPFAPASFDLVIANGGFDTINDLPGALIAARRSLRPDGLFLGALWGAPGLDVLRRIAAAADEISGRAAARIHPQVDVRTAGDLLVRAGFALPVADAETLRLGYRDFDRLLADLRHCGATSVLAQRHAAGRDWWEAARRAFAALAGDDGRVVEQGTLIMLSGWAPALAPA